MPSPTTTDLPIPNSWDEFEDICADLLKCMWSDPYVVRNGRSGQRQHGVDIYGKPVRLKGHGSETAGAQCKRVEALTEEEINSEIEQATGFKPPLEEYLILTTLRRDARLQEYIRTQEDWEINRVEILFWEDLSLQLSGSDELLMKHFPQWFQARTSIADIIQTLLGAEPEDFDYDDSVGQYLYKNDIRLRLIMNRPDEMEPFEEPWVLKFQDPVSYKQEVYLEYNGTKIETFYFAEIDGARYYIPYPKSAIDLRISQFQHRLTCILNGYMGCDTGLSIAGITVDPNL